MGEWVERETGFEPATPSLEGSCSSQLSYSRVIRFVGPRPGPFHRPLPVCFSFLVERWVGRMDFEDLLEVPFGGEGRIRTSVGQRPADLQSAPVSRFGTSPENRLYSSSLVQPFTGVRGECS